MTDDATTQARPKRRNKPTVKFKTHALPPDHPAKPKPAPKVRKPRITTPKELGMFPDDRAQDPDTLNDSARALVYAMVWEGYRRDAAIKHVGISKPYAYSLLRRQAVKAHYLAELDVLASSQKARAIHRLGEIAEQDDNLNAAVQAVKLMLPERTAPVVGQTVNVNITPGYVIDPTRAFAKQQLSKLHIDDAVVMIDQDVSDTVVEHPSQIAAKPQPSPVLAQPHPSRQLPPADAAPLAATVGERAENGRGTLRFWRGGGPAGGGKNGSGNASS